MSVNKLKILPIAICCLVVALWSDSQCMDDGIANNKLQNELKKHTIIDNDKFEIDVGSITISSLSQVPKENFQRPLIRLKNISSERKFFFNVGDPDDRLSISHKILEAIVGGHINTIEYAYAEKKDSDFFKLHEFMNAIAMKKYIFEDNTKKLYLRNYTSDEFRYACFSDITKNCKGRFKFIEISRTISLIDNGKYHWFQEQRIKNQQINSGFSNVKDNDDNRRCGLPLQEGSDSDD